MKKTFTFFLIFVLMLSIAAFPVTAEEGIADDASVSMGSHTIDSSLAVLGSEQLITNARCVLLYETGTDTLLYAWNADERIEPASLVKILTALIAVENGNLEDTIVVKEDVLNTIPKSAVKADIKAGEILTLKDLLHYMMVVSGNDAAAVIADHIAGSQEKFVEMMNTYAEQIGCKNTHFTNVTGLHEPDQYSTARDLGRILATAVKNELFCDVFGKVSYRVPKNNISESRYLLSENYLISGDYVQIYYDGRIKGSRTAVMEDKTRSVASVARSNGMEVVCIVIGSASIYEAGSVKVRSFGGYNETRALYDAAFDGYRPCMLFYEGQVLKLEEVENGDSYVSLGTKTSASTVLPAGIYAEHLGVQFIHEDTKLRAPIEKGQMLSKVKYTYGGKCVAQLDLYAMNSVKAVNDTFVIEGQDGGNGAVWKTIIIIVSVLLLGIVLFFFTPRILTRLNIRKNSKKQKSRQNRR